MGTRNISISEDAYARLMALKKPNESFTQVINRITGKKSILNLAGILTEREAEEFKRTVSESRALGKRRVASIEGKFQTGGKRKRR